MDGEVLRAVMISLNGGLDAPPAFEGTFEGIDVRSTSLVRLGVNDVGMVAVARSETSLHTADGAFQVPGDLVGRQDQALETVAQIMAIDQQTSYMIRSPWPYLGICAEDLDAVGDLPVDVPVTTGRHVPIVRSRIASMDLSALHDRLGGLGYLAEALNASTPIGQYLQLLRLFESAFCMAIRDIHELLAGFLVGTQFNFTTHEVNTWLRARGRSAHADDPKCRYYLSRDVAPYVGRMLEAGYDLLLNKQSWGTPDSARHERWRPAYGSAGTGGEWFVVAGQDLKIGVRLSDMFEAFPVVINSRWTQVLPAAAWIEGDAHGGRTRILGDWQAASPNEAEP